MIALETLISNLHKYTISGAFNFKPNDKLSLVCNIPICAFYSGLYLFYTEENELIYIGISGREAINGEILHRKDGLRGRFLKGKQFGDLRSRTLPKQMMSEGILGLEIHWFVTYGAEEKDIPRRIEIQLLEAFRKETGKLPKWNKTI